MSSDVLEDSPPWWQSLPLVTEGNETPYDVGNICGHSRDKHDDQGRCLIKHQDITLGGNEGTFPNGRVAVIPHAQWFRPECKCPGETVWHVLQWPAGYVWDSLSYDPGWTAAQLASRQEIDANAKFDANGTYRWWVEKKKQ